MEIIIAIIIVLIFIDINFKHIVKRNKIIIILQSCLYYTFK